MDSAQTVANNNNNLSISNNDNGQRPDSTLSSMQASKTFEVESHATSAGRDKCDNISEANENLDKAGNKTSDKVDEEQEKSGRESEKHEGKEDEKNDSSTLSTAFTISFEDESPKSKKLFGIRDSIRKFAPPKPHTIEKPRPSKTENQENCYMSIESAPGGYVKQPFHRGSPANASCRSSGRKSDSSRHSNISESAAFLIDRMLNCKQGESLSSIGLDDKSKSSSQISRSKGTGSGKKKLATRSSDDILDDEIDFCEDKSDNGTYIVGADPESEAARKKIDELFGVVKAAEASIIAESNAKNISRPLATCARQSRLNDKKALPRERQEHINRLATVRNSSRSSSSSRQEMASSASRKQQQSSSRHSRNSSCDRASKLPSGRPRRAASQSSRQSSGKELSDGDTQSSRSSLHNDNIDINNLENQSSNPPSMKFNRAFALRRARLGLGEPMQTGRMTSTPTGNFVSQESDSLNISPRRAINRYGQPSSSGGQQNLSRTDGGRFSLRMKNAPLPARLSNRMSGQQSALIDNYTSKIASSKASATNTTYIGNQTSPLHQTLGQQHTSTTMPYQSGDELEIPSPTWHRAMTSSKKVSQRPDIDASADYNSRYNYSLELDSENYNYTSDNNTRACASAGRRVSSANQLGALDCLVISAISSLSVKIRSSVCDLMVEHAKRLPAGNETRSVVEEILPQLTAGSSRPKSPTSIEEIDQSLYFDLAQALKNLKKVEQIVDVMKLISNQTQPNPTPSSSSAHTTISRSSTHHHQATTTTKQMDGSNSNTNSESNSLSPV